MIKRRKEVLGAVIGCLLFMGVVGWSVHWAFGRIIKTDWIGDAVLKIQRLDRSVHEVQSQLEILGECMALQLDAEQPTSVEGLQRFLDETLLRPIGVRELLLRNLKSGDKIFLKGGDVFAGDMWRASLFDVRRNQQAISALELTEYGPRVVSVVPVSEGSDWVVELTADIEPILQNYARRESCDVALLVPAARFAEVEGTPIVDSRGNQWVLSSSTSPSLQPHLQNKELLDNLGSRAFGMFKDGRNYYGMVLLDGVEYQSSTVPTVGEKASFLLWSDYSGVVAGYLESAQGIILTLWLTAGFFGALLGYFGLKYRRKAKEKIAKSMDKLRQSNQTHAFEAAARQRAEEKLRAVAESIYQGRCEDQAILSQLSHSLKVTASGIIGFGGLSLRKAADDEAKDDAMEFVQAGSQILHQAQNLEVWAQREFYAASFSPSKILLKEALSEALHSFKEWMLRKELTVQLDIENELFVYNDRQILEVLLRNVISNAIKYSPMGQTVKVKAIGVSNGKVQLSVVDEGCGISGDKMAHLFELGADRLSPGTAGEEGVGMGLILVKWASDVLKAPFKMFTDINQGCRVVITFDAGEEPHKA